MEIKELIPALRLDAEWAHANEWETPITLGDHLDAAADALSALLAVTAERDEAVVHGEWILVGTNEHDYETSVEEKCSLCGRYVYRYDTEPQDNFCPNCGAKMGGEGEGSK